TAYGLLALGLRRIGLAINVAFPGIAALGIHGDNRLASCFFGRRDQILGLLLATEFAVRLERSYPHFLRVDEGGAPGLGAVLVRRDLGHDGINIRLLREKSQR